MLLEFSFLPSFANQKNETKQTSNSILHVCSFARLPKKGYHFFSFRSFISSESKQHRILWLVAVKMYKNLETKIFEASTIWNSDSIKHSSTQEITLLKKTFSFLENHNKNDKESSFISFIFPVFFLNFLGNQTVHKENFDKALFLFFKKVILSLPSITNHTKQNAQFIKTFFPIPIF